MSRKKNILIVSAVFPPEQVTSALMNFDLAHELAKDHQVTVLRPYPTRPIGVSFDSADVEGQSFKTILIQSYTHPQSQLIGRFWESIDFGRQSAAYIRKHHQEIDFVYNDGWHLFGLYLVADICRRYGIPYMVPIQDIYPECLLTSHHYPSLLEKAFKGVLLPIDRYYQRHAASVRTISEEMRDYLSRTRKIDISKYLVVNNWQNEADFQKDYPGRTVEGKLIFAYVGSINQHANVDLLIRAFTEAAIPDSEFRIYGGGNQKEECLKLVRDLGLENVVFDQVSRDQVAYVQSQADVLVLALPTGNGNLCLPSKLTSYMLSGKPVLASVDEDSATARILRDSQSGYVVSPDSIDALVEGFRFFSHRNRAELADMSGRSRSYSRQNLSRETNLNLILENINSIIQNGRKEDAWL